MIRFVHASAAALGGLVIAAFLVGSLAAEIAGSAQSVTLVKHLIVWPGLAVLIPALVIAGISGRVLAGPRPGGLAGAKQARMRWIAANGACVLLPCALTLDAWAAHNLLDARFAVVQGIELLAGTINLALIVRNARDGLRLSRAGPQA